MALVPNALIETSAAWSGTGIAQGLPLSTQERSKTSRARGLGGSSSRHAGFYYSRLFRRDELYRIAQPLAVLEFDGVITLAAESTTLVESRRPPRPVSMTARSQPASLKAQKAMSVVSSK